MNRMLRLLATGSFLTGVTAMPVAAQNISVFSSVEPTGQTPVLVLPPTHTFQLLAQFGDTLADGSTLKNAPDFTAFVPKFEQNNLGYLSLNHEIGNQQGAVTVFDLQYDPDSKIWELSNGMPVDLASLNGSSKPCSGAVTPWGTVVYGEEAIVASDLDSNQYHDAGWLVEIRPETRQAIQKIWKAGNAIHENCAVSADQKTVYWGADDPSRGFVFKYVADTKKHLENGKLYVLVRSVTNPSTGKWLQVPNNTPQECNNINTYCLEQGAWNFSGVEDVEIGPYGRIYFAAKYSGRIWRFKDQGATIAALEVFVENTEYPVFTQNGTRYVSWGTGADNLAFDNANNLWVLQDGGDNHIWMVRPSHTADHPNIALFATTPAGSEPTGITFTPNKRFMFLSFQHPNSGNADTLLDVTGRRVVFNRGTTIVIARKEFLGGLTAGNGNTAGCQEEKAFDISVTPNPARSGIITLRSAFFDGNTPVTVEVFDAVGRRCHYSKHFAIQQRIYLDFKAKTNGVYRVRASCFRRIATATLVLEQ